MRHRSSVTLAFALGIILLTALVSACGSGAPTATAVPNSTPVPSATSAPETAPLAAPAQSETTDPSATGVPVGTDTKPVAGDVAAAVGSRTPVPTPTANIVADRVDRLVAEAGLSGKTFLGLSVKDWIDIAISLLITLVGYLLALLGVKLFSTVLKRAVGRTTSEFNDAFVEAIGQELKWLIMVLVLRYALLRLGFWSDGLRTLIDDVFFVLALGVVAVMALKVISFAAQWYRDHLDPDVDKIRLEPIILLVQRSGYVLVLIIGVSIGLSHFGIQITVLSAALILGALALSLGARDVISDAISSFIILVDQPFRVGDVIEIEKLDTWGTVIDIGTRTTRIRTRDERFAIVPNSRIGASQVINYTFPDPQYRVYSDIRVAYGSNFDQVRRVVHDAVRDIEGVLPDQPVDVIFHEYGVAARVMRVRWWIDDMQWERRITDQVHETLEIAFDRAGIEMPVTTRELVIRNDPKTVEQCSQAPGESKTSK